MTFDTESVPNPFFAENTPTQHTESPPDRGSLLVIDDDPSMLRACQRLLTQEGFKVVATPDPERALELADAYEVDAALIDVRMPICDGRSLMQIMQRKRPDVAILLMTAYADIQTAVKAIQEGAFDFLTKPFEDPEALLMRIDRAIAHKRLSVKARRLEQEVGDRYHFANIVGHSPRLGEVFRMVEKIAPSDSNVLIQGESGTGKELIARSIHFNSHRRERPVITVNCSAITESLFESELFGHEKGAFTGAIQRKKGLFEEAHTGTIFLDEIGEVPLSVQPKLLRVLQEGEIRRVGGTEVIKVDVRIIAATNRDLSEWVSAGAFREDLFYRLNVITLDLPPLRERRDDIPLLVMHFLQKYARRGGSAAKAISPEALQVLENYGWPGNIRELENIVERAVVLAESDCVGLAALPAHLLDNAEWAGLKGMSPMEQTYREAKNAFVTRFDRTYGSMMLERAGGNVTAAAEMAGMDRSNFRKILRRAGLLLRDQGLEPGGHADETDARTELRNLPPIHDAHAEHDGDSLNRPAVDVYSVASRGAR